MPDCNAYEYLNRVASDCQNQRIDYLYKMKDIRSIWSENEPETRLECRLVSRSRCI